MSAAVTVYGMPFWPGGVFTSTNTGANWIANDAPTNRNGWYAVAASVDGIKLAVMMVDALTPAGPYGWTYTSTNSGVTWEQDTSMAWPCHLASSADGTILVAAKGKFGPLGGWVITSTNSGATWEEDIPGGGWSSVACSADGTRLVAVIGADYGNPTTGPLYISADSGATWAAGDSPTNNWGCIASAVNGGGIYFTFGNSQSRRG